VDNHSSFYVENVFKYLPFYIYTIKNRRELKQKQKEDFLKNEVLYSQLLICKSQ